MQNHIQKFEEYVEKEGLEGLLPHNLADDILERFLKELDALHDDESTKTPASTLFLAIFHLSTKKKILVKNKKIKLTMSPEEFQTKFETYSTLINIEELNRKTNMTFKSENPITLDNIFDKNQKFQAFEA